MIIHISLDSNGSSSTKIEVKMKRLLINIIFYNIDKMNPEKI